MATSSGKVSNLAHLKMKPHKNCWNLPKTTHFRKLRGLLHFLPQPSNIFTQIYLPYLWHFATLLFTWWSKDDIISHCYIYHDQLIISSFTPDQTVELCLAVGANLLNGRIAFLQRIDFYPQSQGWQIINGKHISNGFNNKWSNRKGLCSRGTIWTCCTIPL